MLDELAVVESVDVNHSRADAASRWGYTREHIGVGAFESTAGNEPVTADDSVIEHVTRLAERDVELPLVAAPVIEADRRMTSYLNDRVFGDKLTYPRPVLRIQGGVQILSELVR